MSDVNENENLPKTAEFIKCEEEKIDGDPLSRERCAAQCSPMPRAMCAHLLANIFHNVYYLVTGLQKLCNPAIPDGKTQIWRTWKTWKTWKTSSR